MLTGRNELATNEHGLGIMEVYGDAVLVGLSLLNHV
jgi:hypothetical protein